MDNDVQSYNCRVYDYPAGQHVTFYKQAINKGVRKNEYLKKTYQNAERTEHEEKHCNAVSASATKNRIYNITRSNTWDWFITMTFDREKVDSGNYDIVIKKLQKFIEHLRERKCPDLKYIIVPELHSDGIHFHFHGLLANCGNMHFQFSGHYTKGRKSQPIFNMPDWSFGFTTATKIQDSSRASSYICKYITKDCAKKLKEKNKYYCSHNVNRVQPDYFVQDEEDFLKVYNDRIQYIKSIEVKEANQVITYYELSD